MRQQRLQGLEAGVDALHATPLVAVGNLTADSPLLILSRLGAEGNVGQTEAQEKSGDDTRQSSSSSSSMLQAHNLQTLPRPVRDIPSHLKSKRHQTTTWPQRQSKHSRRLQLMN